jgi:hypothetical protein
MERQGLAAVLPAVGQFAVVLGEIVVSLGAGLFFRRLVPHLVTWRNWCKGRSLRTKNASLAIASCLRA